MELFKKVGGKQILLQYFKAHVLLFSLVITGILGFSKKSLEIVRLAVNNRVLCKLRKKYRKFIADYVKNHTVNKGENSDKVWVCWLQGMENAPLLVQSCYKSLQENLKNKEIILITEDNYRNYVTFPDFIQKKIDSGIITRTHFSDLLRLELLIKYGGTWVDATVFCSGNDYPEYMFDSDLFVFQCLKPGLDGHCHSISSWFMTACINNPIIILTRDLLYEYWKKNNSMADYFLIHDMFQLAIETYPEEWKNVIPFSNSIPHILLLRMFEKYNENVWEAVKNMTCFHKLSYKFDKSREDIIGSYYSVIIEKEK